MACDLAIRSIGRIVHTQLFDTFDRCPGFSSNDGDMIPTRRRMAIEPPPSDSAKAESFFPAMESLKRRLLHLTKLSNSILRALRRTADVGQFRFASRKQHLPKLVMLTELRHEIRHHHLARKRADVSKFRKYLHSIKIGP